MQHQLRGVVVCQKLSEEVVFSELHPFLNFILCNSRVVSLFRYSRQDLEDLDHRLGEVDVPLVIP